jgi:preprotein translocase subunit SecF
MKYENPTKFIVISFLLAITILILCALQGCGTRKVNKSNTEIKETTKTELAIVDSSKINTKIDSNIKITVDTDTDEITINPVDNSKEMVVNGKKYFNSSLTHKKVKENKVINKTKTIANNEQKAVKINGKTNKEKTTSVAVKNTEKTQSYYWLLWIFLLIPIYFFIRKWLKL